MVGSPEPLPHCHVDCLCGKHEQWSEGCYCPDHAKAYAIAQGFDPDRDVVEGGEERDDSALDSMPWCSTCDALLTGSIDPECAADELAHWESQTPANPIEWRDFMLCVVGLDDALLPRLAVVVSR